MNKYELIVIGSGPAGESAAKKAASYGYKVAVVEREKKINYLSNSSSLPSKILKESSFFLTDQGESGIDHLLKRQASAANFRYRKNYISESEDHALEGSLKQYGIDLYRGTASFQNAHTVVVQSDKKELLQAGHIIIATGSFPFHPDHLSFDGKRVHDADTILQIETLPKSLCIVGAGVIGCEYTTIFSSMGAKVTLINDREKILPQIDREVSSELLFQMKTNGVDIHLGTTAKTIETPDDPSEPLKVTLDNGTIVKADLFLFAAGRLGNTKGLGCESIGLALSPRHTIEVDSTYQTNIPHIFAVGDVIGFPSLASTSMDQGRLAVTHMFNKQPKELLPKVLPFGIYTVPEITMAGLTEEEAQDRNIDYCVGMADYKETTRSKIIGIERGFLKLIFSTSDLKLLGIHIIGPFATEIIHYGVELMENNKTIYHIVEDVFNYPTLHDLYKLAAENGLKTLSTT